MMRIILALCVMFLLSPAAIAQELKQIKIGYPAISYNQIHIWVAKEAGLFKKYGLDAEIIFFRGGQTATQALVAGDPPIVNIGTVVQAGLQGHASTPRTIEGSRLVSPKQQPQKLLVYMAILLMSRLNTGCYRRRQGTAVFIQ